MKKINFSSFQSLKFWKFLASFVIIVFAVSGIVYFNGAKTPIAKAATVDATLFFSPASTSQVVGADFNLVARVNPGSNTVQGINAIELHVTFDPAVLQLSSITKSSAFGTIFQAAAIDNNAGTGSIILMTPAQPDITATADIATFAFHTQAAGINSPVAFTAASDAAVNDGNGTLVVGTRTGATVTIGNVGPDISPPTRSNKSPSGKLSWDTTQKTLSLNTNEDATCRYSTTSGVAYDSMTNTFTTTGVTSHSTLLSGLTENTHYNYYVRCIDLLNNPNTDDYLISFAVSKKSSGSSDDSEKPKKYKINNTPHTLSRGQVITETGKRFSKNSLVMLFFSKPGGGYYPTRIIRTTEKRTFSITYRIPLYRSAGKYHWYALDLKSGAKSKRSYYTVK
jgi:hypothetical protein